MDYPVLRLAQACCPSSHPCRIPAPNPRTAPFVEFCGQFQALSVILGTCAAVLLVVFGFGRLALNSSTSNKETGGAMAFGFVVGGFGLAALCALYYYALRVVFLDYTYVTENPSDQRFRCRPPAQCAVL